MHASHELVASAQGEFDATPADCQVALAAKPMRIDPATCAWGDPFGALCDQIAGRDDSYATQTLSSFRRTDQRRLQLEASGVIISEVRFSVTTQPRLRKRLPLRRLIAHPKPVFRTVCGPTEGKMDGGHHDSSSCQPEASRAPYPHTRACDALCRDAVPDDTSNNSR